MTNQKIMQEKFKTFWSQLIRISLSRTQMFADCGTTSNHRLSIDVWQDGFNLRLTLTEETSRIEIYIKLKEGRERTEKVFKALLARRDNIESLFGRHICWEILPSRIGCRISTEIDGGWGVRDESWMSLQCRIIDNAVKLEEALRKPI